MKPIQLIGIFLLGLIAGLIVGMLLMGRKVDDLTLENQLLLGHAQDLEARLKRLESLEKKAILSNPSKWWRPAPMNKLDSRVRRLSKGSCRN